MVRSGTRGLLAPWCIWAFSLILTASTAVQAQVPSNSCSAFTAANEYPVTLSCTPVAMNTNGFTPDYNPGGCLAGNNDDAWAYFTAITSQTQVQYEITGCQGFLCGLFVTAILHVFEGNCGAPVALGCNISGLGIGNDATVTIPTTPGQTYFVRVQRTFSNQDLSGELCITAISNAPANDLCSNATPVGDGTFPFTTIDATGSFATSCAFNDTNSVWFAYTATCSDEATFSVCDDADFDSVISVFDACGGNELACNDDYFGCTGFTSQVTIPVLAGQTYLVRLAGFQGAAGSGNLTISCAPPPPPAPNDDCANATAVAEGLHPFTTVNATGTLSTSCSLNDTNDVWFAYTASCSGLVEVSTCGNAFFDSTIGIYDACGGGELACNDDGPGCIFFESTVEFVAFAGSTYWVRIAGFQGDEGNGAVSITCTDVTWYSQASGNTSDPIWALAPSGTPVPAVFDPAANIVVQAGHTVVQDQPVVDALVFSVQAGASYDLGSGNTLNVGGNWSQDGEFITSDGGVRLTGSSLQVLDGLSTLRFHDLELDNPAGARVDADSLLLDGTLQLAQGSFDANGRQVVLVSDASGTARLGPVAPGASYAGALRVQRFVPAGATNWRGLSAPISTGTLAQWKQDFFTAGFPGSHAPSFDSPPGSGILWPSIRTYDESDPGPDMADGLEGPGHITDPFVVGRGYMAWCGDALLTTDEFVIDVRGTPVVAQSPLALPVGWTDTGDPAVDGWNLLGNPLPSPIDFGQIALGADVESEFWVFDPVAGTNAFWNETLGMGSSVMNGNIQSSQAFWVHATGPSVTTTVSESAKTLDPDGGAPFGGMQLDQAPYLRMGLSCGMNAFRDEVLVHFGAGAPGLDGPDMEMLEFAHQDAPRLWTASADGDRLALNAWGEVSSSAAIPVHVNTAVTGDHTLEVMQLTQPMEGYCLLLEDLETGTLTEVVPGATYTFTLDASAPADPARFLLHVSQLPEGTLTASATEVLVGEAVTFGSGTQPGALVTWDFGDGTTSTEEAPVHAYTLPGSYPVTLTVGSAPCDLVLTEVIEVGISTGLEDLEGEAFSAWTEGDAIRLRWSFAGSGVHEVKLFDPRGREVKALRLSEASGQATLELGGHPDGVYVLRLLGADRVRTVRLPVVR